jgi:IS5 family transposase
MEAVLPWQALIELIVPHDPKTNKKGGRPPCPLMTTLGIHLQQQWYSLSDPAMEEALIEVPTMRSFASIDVISDRIPDETTILSFRHLLEKHQLGEQILKPSMPKSAQRCLHGATGVCRGCLPLLMTSLTSWDGLHIYPYQSSSRCQQ